jgi:hypothetical protein
MIYFVSNVSELFENGVYKVVSVEKSLELLETIKIVGLDTETEGFDPYTKKLLSLQLWPLSYRLAPEELASQVPLFSLASSLSPFGLLND